jgi:7-cyano-7-deazaguanine synthase
MKSVILFSGGIDSAVCLAMCRDHERYAVGFDYGQPHQCELDHAEEIAAAEGVTFKVIKLNLRLGYEDEECPVFAIRNALFVTYGAAYASLLGADRVVIGSNQSDWTRFPDCRPAFYTPLKEAFDAAHYSVRISTPLLHMTKAEVVRQALDLEAHLDLTWSCYCPGADDHDNIIPCGGCLACQVRGAALEANGL